MLKKICCATLIVAPLFGVAPLKVQYIVRKQESPVRSKKYNLIRAEIDSEISTSKDVPAGNKLMPRLAVMSYISDRVRECFAQKLVEKFGKNKTEEIINALINEEKEGLLTSTYIENEYQRNILTPDPDYLRFQNAGVDTLGMVKFVEKVVDCDIINTVLKETLRRRLVAGPAYFVDPSGMDEINSFLQLIEEVMLELFSDHTTEEKDINLNKIIIEDKIRLQTEKKISGKGVAHQIPETKKLLRARMLGIIQKAVKEELLRQAQMAKTLVLPLPIPSVVKPATVEDVWSLAIALESIPA